MSDSSNKSLLEQLNETEIDLKPSPSHSSFDVRSKTTDALLAKAKEISKPVSLKEEPETVEQVGIQQVAVSVEEAHALAKGDLDFLGAICMPDVFEFSFPPVFQSSWQWLLSFVHKVRIFPQLALGLPRGFGKTTIIKIFIVYCILFTTKKFILVISATQDLAENIVSDVIDMLEEPNIRNIFGDWSVGVTKDTQKLKKFGYRGRNITLAAIGAQGSLRGLNLKNERIDVMIFEDIQTREQADSKLQSNTLEVWMIGTAMKAKSPKGCMFLFIANMYPTEHSILRKLKKNKKWTKFISGGILEDGTSLWEELQPIEQLLSEFENDLEMGHPEIFYAEVLNDENASVNNLVNISSLPSLPMEEGDIPVCNFVVIDPSNDKANSDAVAIGYFEVHNTFPVLMEAISDKLSPGDTIREALRLMLTHNCKLCVIEAQAFQYSLLYWFDFMCTQLSLIGLEAIAMYSGVASKNTRILNMFKSLTAGEVFMHPNVRMLVIPQITGFNPLRRDNTDDLLDLMTYAPRVVAEYGEYMLSLNVISLQEFDEIEVIENNSPF